jgi:hypothetical protein
MKRILGIFALATVLSTPALAVDLLIDDFESYPDTATMMLPANWGGQSGAAAGANGVLESNIGGRTDKAMKHPGGATSNHVFTPTVIGAGEYIDWSFDFYDDGVGNKRLTSGMRNNGNNAPGVGPAIIEVGRYNAFAAPNAAAAYGVRTALITGSSDWQPFLAAGGAQIPVTQGWHSFHAVINPLGAIFEFDKGDDGVVDSTVSVPTLNTATLAWNVIRFGGPSGVASGGGPAWLDNVSVKLLPEPGTLALLGASALTLVRRRR